MDEGIWGDVDVGPAREAGNCRGELVFVFIGTSSITSLVSIFPSSVLQFIYTPYFLLEARPYQTLQIKVQTYNNNPWQKNNHTDDKENEGEMYIHAHTKKKEIK
jgi:hypothetical protein